MDHYYATGKPLSANALALHRVCKAFAPDEQANMQTVLQEFFTLRPDGYHNDRADKEIFKSLDISEKRRFAQAEREKKRLANAGALAPTTTTTTTVDSKKTPIPPKRVIDPMEIKMAFDRLWYAYPGRGKNRETGIGYNGKRAPAYDKFERVYRNQGEDHEGFIGNIIEACARYGAHLDRSGYPSQHLSTWLNQRGWEDDYSSAAGKDSRSSSGYSLDDVMRKALADKTGDFKRNADGSPNLEFLNVPQS